MLDTDIQEEVATEEVFEEVTEDAYEEVSDVEVFEDEN